LELGKTYECHLQENLSKALKKNFGLRKSPVFTVYLQT